MSAKNRHLPAYRRKGNKPKAHHNLPEPSSNPTHSKSSDVAKNVRITAVTGVLIALLNNLDKIEHFFASILKVFQ